jgi:hypothetical protein
VRLDAASALLLANLDHSLKYLDEFLDASRLVLAGCQKLKAA